LSRLEEFRAFCSELALDNGKRMILEPFQETMLKDLFEGVRESARRSRSTRFRDARLRW
jgi:hypothetical protein